MSRKGEDVKCRGGKMNRRADEKLLMRSAGPGDSVDFVNAMRCSLGTHATLCLARDWDFLHFQGCLVQSVYGKALEGIVLFELSWGLWWIERRMIDGYTGT